MAVSLLYTGAQTSEIKHLFKCNVLCFTIVQKHFFSPCKNTAVVVWCNDSEADIYEVETQEDFDNCSNLPDDQESDTDSDDEMQGFLVKPGKTRHFVSKSQCDQGMKAKIEFEEC